MPDNIWYPLASSVIGSSHLKSGLPCQDASDSRVFADGRWAALVVSDGHGSSKHFRSDRGAAFAVSCLMNMFESIWSPLDSDTPDRSGALEYFKRSAKAAVLASWGSAVAVDLVADPLNVDAPDAGLKRHLVETLERGGASAVAEEATRIVQIARLAGTVEETQDYAKISNPYGATLLGILIGPQDLLWFQLGDGMLAQVASGVVSHVVDSPAEAFANATPSLCSGDALRWANTGHRMRVGGQPWPDFVVVATDGVDNSYANDDALFSFLTGLADGCRSATPPSMEELLPRWLRQMSDDGSTDDASIALAYRADLNAQTMTTEQMIDQPERVIDVDEPSVHVTNDTVSRPSDLVIEDADD